VTAEHRGGYIVRTETGDLRATVTGRALHDASGRGDLPAVGDWIALERLSDEEGIVRGILTRRSKFSRKVAWNETEEQIVAVNVDALFIVTSLNSDLSLRRIERYLTMAWESGAMPVVILTKSDLADHVADAVAEVITIAPGVPVHAVSAVEGDGIDELGPYFEGAKTVALVGSSGTGKSTLINTLMGQETQLVKDIRSDDKGRHTTTHRELLMLPTGGLVIDTPGMRELQLWDGGEGLGTTFQDVESLVAGCRFNDCTHVTEPGCAVLAAIQDGSLPLERLESYRKLERELAYLARRQDQRAANAEKKKWKAITKSYRRSAHH
jgi:ribosome biogenesis GTPase